MPHGPAPLYEGDVPMRDVLKKWPISENLADVEPLDPRIDLSNHSPDGFNWGYMGSGPAQLALALVADATGDDALALEVYQEFKAAVVARLPMLEPFSLRRDVVLQVVKDILTCRLPPEDLALVADVRRALAEEPDRVAALRRARDLRRSPDPVQAEAARLFLIDNNDNTR